jgi:hypothetical protein
VIRTEAELDEHLRVLMSDLTTLYKLVVTYGKPVAEGDIRLASVILRKWLVEGLLTKLCHAAKVSATIPALDTTEMCKAIDGHPHINYFLSAGVSFNGRPLQSIYNATIPSTGKPLVELMMKERLLGVKEFLRHKRMYFEGTFFTCQEIIKYVANKLGGAHLDLNRTKHAKLDRAAAYMTYGGPHPQEGRKPPSEIYMILEPQSAEILSGVHVEIIAAAASFIQLHLNGEQLTHFDRWQPKRTGNPPGWHIYEGIKRAV